MRRRLRERTAIASLAVLIAVATAGCHDSPVEVVPTPPTPPKITHILVGVGAPSQRYVLPGMTLNMYAQANDSAQVIVPVSSFAWSTSAEDVATVDQDGHVTTKRTGDVSIYAEAGGMKGAYRMSVRSPQSIFSLFPDTSRLFVGQERALRRLSTDIGFGPEFSSVSGAGSSSNPAVVQVDTLGTLRGVSAGTARVSVPSSYGGATFTLSAEVTVQSVPAPLRFLELARGDEATCGRTATDTWCWGNGASLGTSVAADRCGRIYSYYGHSGNRISEFYTLRCAMEPVRVEAPEAFASISVRDGTPCGLVADGRAYCWGNAQPFSGVTTPSPVPVLASATLRFASFSYPCGVTLTHEAWCWGRGSTRGATDTLATSSRVEGGAIWERVAGGSSTHRCGLTTAGTVSCWGANDRGQLGTGDTVSSMVPVPVKSSSHFTAIVTKDYTSCGLTDAGALECWGLGHPTPFQPNPGVQFTTLAGHASFEFCALTTAGMPYCGPGDVALVALPVTMPFRTIDVRFTSYCGIATDGLAYCWGRNYTGELGVGDAVIPPFEATLWPSPTRVVGQ